MSPTVIAMLEPLLGSPLTIAEVVARARDGHAPSRRVLADTGHHVGVVLAALPRCSPPAASWSAASSPRRARCCSTRVHAALTAAALPGTRAPPTVTTAALAEHAPVLGALALALERCAATL